MFTYTQVRLVGVSVNHAPWLVVQEFLKFGDLRNVLIACREKNITLTYPEQLHIAQQLASGMAFMSSKVCVCSYAPPIQHVLTLRHVPPPFAHTSNSCTWILRRVTSSCTRAMW